MFVNVVMNAIRQYLTHQQALWLDTFQPLDYGALAQVPKAVLSSCKRCAVCTANLARTGNKRQKTAV